MIAIRPKRRYLLLLPLILLGVYWLFCLPRALFPAPTATELLSAEGELLSARTAADGQWRLPAPDSVAAVLPLAVLHYEDRNFYRHWGVSLRGIVRAVRDNWRAGRVVSGGSTLTMQVARMARGNRPRTLWQKMVEACWATRMEWRYDKEEILNLWLAQAPFGGNTVGIEAAAYRYYGRSPANLSWAEAATLAVLPNSPGLIHPGRSRDALRRKRDRLLESLSQAGHLTVEDLKLALLEPLPGAPLPRPRDADHLLERLRKAHGPGRYRSSVEAGLQRRLTRLVGDHQRSLAGNRIGNVACMVSEVATGRVIAYVGNAPDVSAEAAPHVDIITAPRSPGSLLKPLLYGLSLAEGRITSRQLLPDVPTSFGAFRPANFHLGFDGAVSANEALARSLNIPFVHLLREYGVERFHDRLRGYGFGQLGAGAGHYGLSLILGGGEITMEEIHGWFLGLARQQLYFHERQGMYAPGDWGPPTLLRESGRHPLHRLEHANPPITAGAGYLTLSALSALTRPDENGRDHRFVSGRPVAWKTGTSFGFRDAWAVGCTPAYVVSVWAGNADGEGRPGLVGVRAAAPLLFRVFRELEDRATDAPRWFEEPADALTTTRTCSRSGYLAGADCPADSLLQVHEAERAAVCPHHRRVFTDPEGHFRVRQQCGPGPPVATSWFELPPRQAHYYQKRHADYRPLPPLHPDCGSAPTAAMLEFIFPYRDGVLSPGRNWRGDPEPLLFEVAHHEADATIHWHLDGRYLGSTRQFHGMAIDVPPGTHRVTVTDEEGNSKSRGVEVR